MIIFSSSHSLYIEGEKLPLTFLNQNPVIFWGSMKQNCLWHPVNQDVSASSGQGHSWVIAEVPERGLTVQLESWALLQSVSGDESGIAVKNLCSCKFHVSCVMELGEWGANPAVTNGEGPFFQASQNTAFAGEPELWIFPGWADSTEEQKSLTGAIKVKCSCEQPCL